MNIIKKIFQTPGYVNTTYLEKSDVEYINLQILKQIKETINVDLINLDDYASNVGDIKHSLLSSKKSRIFSSEVYYFISNTKWFHTLVKLFPDLQVTNEECLEGPEIYWRVVRPNISGGVGPLHADAWFWQMGIGKIPIDRCRVKAWVHLAGDEPGLKYVENSHLFEFSYAERMSDGKRKPVFDDSQINDVISILPPLAGRAFLFNDRLLHGGLLSTSSTRVSFEFTFTTSRRFVIDSI